MRFGLQVQSMPARLAPVAVERILAHYIANRRDGETFRELRAALQGRVLPRNHWRISPSPARSRPEVYKDWGDDRRLLAASSAAASARRRHALIYS